VRDAPPPHLTARGRCNLDWIHMEAWYKCGEANGEKSEWHIL
jgi:hypothetical protein